MKTQRPLRGMHKQRGLVVVIVTVAMFLLMAVAAFAIDINHAIMNRTKLQNSVDSAALAAAVTLDKLGTKDEAEQAARNLLTVITDSDIAPGNEDLVFDQEGATITVEFSNVPTSFLGESYSDDPEQDRYVRVEVKNLEVRNFFFARLMGVTKLLTASAVAGPSSTTGSCDLVPITVCGDESASGYTQGITYRLKAANPSDTLAPGNFQLLDYGATGGGANDLRDHLAGGYDQCLNLETVNTKPGNNVGPSLQGANTRFGDYNGPLKGYEADYPPDVYVKPDDKLTENEAPNFSYSDYQNHVRGAIGENADGSYDCSSSDSYCKANGVVGRRVVQVPIIDCDGLKGGSNTAVPVMSIGCFFLLAKLDGKDEIYGEFISKCTTKGGRNDGTSDLSGPHRIVLFKDPYRWES